MPSALDVELHPGRIRNVSDPVRGTVRVPRPGMGRVVGEQVRVISQAEADCAQFGPELVQIARDQRAGVRVEASQRSWWVLVSLRT
jgi:hypothetical protein